MNKLKNKNSLAEKQIKKYQTPKLMVMIIDEVKIFNKMRGIDLFSLFIFPYHQRWNSP
jgi:hypothetical protein